MAAALIWSCVLWKVNIKNWGGHSYPNESAKKQWKIPRSYSTSAKKKRLLQCWPVVVSNTGTLILYSKDLTCWITELFLFCDCINSLLVLTLQEFKIQHPLNSEPLALERHLPCKILRQSLGKLHENTNSMRVSMGSHIPCLAPLMSIILPLDYFENKQK